MGKYKGIRSTIVKSRTELLNSLVMKDQNWFKRSKNICTQDYTLDPFAIDIARNMMKMYPLQPWRLKLVLIICLAHYFEQFYIIFI